MRGFGDALVLTILIVCLWSCGGGHKNTNGPAAVNSANVPGETANTVKTNIEELQLLINVPYEVDDVVWKEDPARKKVVAVLHFSKADADKLVAESSGRQPPQNVAIPSESWYPAELIAQSEMSGEDSLKGTSLTADRFFMEPYTSGRVIRIAGTDYFVLQLTAK